MESEKLKLKNYLEDLVLETVESVLSNLDHCKCDRCINDIAAIVLNELPARYVVTSEGEVYTRLDAFSNHYKVQVLTAVTKAVHRVNESPRHSQILKRS